jgi:nitrogen regulatory protein P-II 1
MMKKIEAVIRVEKLQIVRKQLEKAGYPGLTRFRVEGHGKQKGRIQQFRGRQYKQELLPKMRIEIVAKDEDVERIVKAVSTAAKTGEIGNGKIFVSPIENAIRIRTGEKAEDAL